MPGSFDPFTLGHWDIATRAARLFDRVVVAVGVNHSKQALLTTEARVRLAREALRDLPNLEVGLFSGLLVDYCREQGADFIVRGARSGADFEAEWAMAAMNSSLAGVETIILPASPSVGFISSTLVRSVAQAGGDLSAYVPANVAMSIMKEL